MHIYPSLVLVQPRKTRPCLSERLLMGRKESNQTNQPKVNVSNQLDGIIHIPKTDFLAITGNKKVPLYNGKAPMFQTVFIVFCSFFLIDSVS